MDKNNFLIVIKNMTGIKLEIQDNAYHNHHNRNKNILYIKISLGNKIPLLSFLKNHKIRYAEHLDNCYFIWINDMEI